jgi:hypothetical protein
MRLGSAGPAGGPVLGNLVMVGVLLAAAYVLSQGLTRASFTYTLGALAAVTLFGLVFLRNDFGIYVVTFSMLLSPEFTAGGGGMSEGRSIMVRSEDFILIVIGLAWLAKTAVNKELGLVAKTPLNRPILAYIVANLLATLLGYLWGTVGSNSGFFYVLKYVEYFVVYYMVVNNVQDRAHARRLVVAAFLTAAIVSVVGIAQIPSGERVSAPFEGEIGEPNTFGGYLLLMIAIAAGVALETYRFRMRVVCVGLVALMALPFTFTLSRASYVGVPPALLVLAWFTRQRKVMIGAVLVLVVCSPILAVTLPSSVTKRVLYTFEPEKGQATVHIGKVGLDPSTSARLISFQGAIEGWLSRPVFGHGVTGFGFMDAQYARVLVETGIVGLATFAWLIWTVLRSSALAFRELSTPEDRGVALGFMAGTFGLLAHAIGSNTFIIVRIMEPFWFFAGIVLMLPQLERAESKPIAAPVVMPARLRPDGGAALRT